MDMSELSVKLWRRRRRLLCSALLQLVLFMCEPEGKDARAFPPHLSYSERQLSGLVLVTSLQLAHKT